MKVKNMVVNTPLSYKKNIGILQEEHSRIQPSINFRNTNKKP
jgi:hypothetical protein